MLVLKIVLWCVGLFIGYHFVVGFIEGLRKARQPQFRVVCWDDEQEESK